MAGGPLVVVAATVAIVIALVTGGTVDGPALSAESDALRAPLHAVAVKAAASMDAIAVIRLARSDRKSVV